MASTTAVTTVTLLPEKVERHLRGVKWRLLWVFVAFGVGSSLSWYFRKIVIDWLLLPAGGLLSASGRPIFTEPTEMLSIIMNLTMKGGLVVAFPVLVYHIARFLSPILSPKQRRFIAIFLPAGFVCFVLGVAFTYFVLLPTGLRFLMSFGTDIADPMIRITSYLGLVLAMLFWMGIVFELPLAMFLLSKMRVVSHQHFKKFRRYVPVSALLLGALITPTFDPLNQMLVAVPLILLYEAGIFLAWLARPKKKRMIGVT